MKHKRLIVILLISSIILLVPFIAMQFTDEVNWKASDFVVGGFLIFGTGIGCEIVLRLVKKPKSRIVMCLTLLFALLLIWAELAVGIFD